MPKSKFPQELDTSIEIPPVRDNILEVGSDAINSLRSAIFNIERALGINPQGAVGNTLSERVSRSLDGNGNIKADALNRANVLSGPIIDANVSTVAAIQESKLKLNYPTTLLQDEISILNTSISTLVQQSEELSIALAAHTNSSATNRHPSTAISVSSHAVVSSDTALIDLSTGSVQATFEEVIDSHIGYSGANIASDNSSHIAAQIYFNNDNVSSIIPSDDMQTAMEDLATTALNSQINHQSLQHSNGILKVGDIDSATNTSIGNIFAEDISISFVFTTGLSSGVSIVTLNDVIPIGDFILEKSDILTISDASDTSLIYSGEYEIESFTLVAGNITSISVYGIFGSDSTSLTLGRISKNIKDDANLVGLLSAVREEAVLTSARSVQICNPNSVKVVSSGLRPMEITTTNRFIDVVIDSETAETIDIYNGAVSVQSIDSVVSRINEQCAEDSLGFLAYRVDYELGRSELAIAYNLPDEVGELHTITIERSSDSGIDAAGFVHLEDVIVSSDFGTNYYINGNNYEGLITKLDSTDLSFLATTLIIDSSSSGLDFLSIGLKVHDLVVITDAANSDDDGSYIIESVSSTQLVLGSSQLPSGFAGSSQDSTRFRVYSNIASFDNTIFSEVSSTFGSLLSDVFLSSDRKVGLDKRFEYTAEIVGSSSLVVLVDFEGDIANKDFSLDITSGTDLITMTLDSGESIEARSDNGYVWIKSGLENVRLKFMIPSISAINTKIISSGFDITMTFFGFEGVNPDSNILISRVPFNNFNGRVDGGEEAPRAFSIIQRGNIGINDLSSGAIKDIAERPINELRSNGVICGLEITGETTTSDLFTFDVGHGTCYVNGKRIEVEPQATLISHIDSTATDKIFIAVNEYGMIKVQPATPSCECSFNPNEYCLLASLEFDGTIIYNIDVRLFINDLDFKLLNSVTVSPRAGMGHFSELGKAVKYTKRFSQMFSDAGTPTIHLKSGTHSTSTVFDNSGITYADWLLLPAATIAGELYDGLILAGLVIDFPVNITGESDSTIVSLRNQYIFSDVTYNLRGSLAVIGDGFTSNTAVLDVFTSGFITLKDFNMDNCKFSFVDLNISDGANDLIFGVDLENITMDMRDFSSNPFDTALGPIAIEITEQDDTAINKGNISVRNSKFIINESEASISLISITDASRVKNLSFINNRMMGADPANSVTLFDKDIWNFTTANSGSNIELMGNLASSSLSTTAASRSTIGVGTTDWGDRIGRSLNVGGELTTEGDVTVGGGVTGDSYTYNGSYSRHRYIFMDKISDPAMGSTSGSAVNFSTETINGVEWKTAAFTNAGATTEFARVRLDLSRGETISAIGLYTSSIASGSSLFSNYSVEINSHDQFGVQTSEAPAAISLPTGSGDMRLIPFSVASLVGDVDKHYWIEIIRVAASGFDEELHYVVVETSMTTVEAIGGLY